MCSKFFRYSLLRFESIRRSTFENSPFVDSRSMAAAGFYFSGCDTTCICFSCGIVVSNWNEPVMTPMARHMLLFRSCGFINGYDVSLPNVDPLFTVTRNLETQTYLPPMRHGAYECKPTDFHRLLDCESLENPPEQLAVGRLPKNFEDIVVPITIHIRIPPHSPNFVMDSKHLLILLRSEEERVKTFNAGGWCRSKPTKQQLAKAGFYHLQVPEYTQCAFCLLIVSLWSDVNPMDFHKKSNRNCPLMKGEECGNLPCIDQPATESRTACVVCLTRERKIVFIPCRHFICCVNCTTENKFANCPLCRESVSRTERVYFS
jgi:hypothetical protein